MRNVIPFPRTRRLREEASHWLVSLDEGLTPGEKIEIESWLRADPAHARVLVEQARVWDDLEILSELAGIYPLEEYPTTPRWRMRPVAIAASLAVAVLGSVLIAGVAYRDGEPAAQPPGSAIVATQPQPTRQYRTAVGEQLSARLPDGSVVSINTDTELEVRFSPAGRLVQLRRGEALFDVAHDAARPFRVEAGERMFEALGTVFNVQRDPHGGLELVVTEGRVRVLRTMTDDPGIAGPSADAAPASGDITIAAGQSVSIVDTAQEIRLLAAADVDARLAWKRGMLVFRGESLADVLAEVERYTATRFIWKDAAVAAVPVGGYFRTGDVEGVLLALRETFGIETRRINETQVELSLR